MKVKTDFVTNSSSTSFLLICNDEITKDSFLEFLGVENDSMFYSMVEELYEEMTSGLKTIEEEFEEGRNKAETIEEFITNEFSEEAYKRYLTAKENGIIVYTGMLSSDQGLFSTFVCCDHFIEESETYYIHYTNCYW